MHTLRIAVFGESEKGKFAYPYVCKSLLDLYTTLGSPPKESEGLNKAIQNILLGGEVLFFRVKSEGFSEKEYLNGLRFLEKYTEEKNLDGICLPGVGDELILHTASKVSSLFGCLLILEEKDLFDYFTR